MLLRRISAPAGETVVPALTACALHPVQAVKRQLEEEAAADRAKAEVAAAAPDVAAAADDAAESSAAAQLAAATLQVFRIAGWTLGRV